MLKPPTGEPCAGEPHARFGGRGESILFPTPIIPPACWWSLMCAWHGALTELLAQAGSHKMPAVTGRKGHANKARAVSRNGTSEGSMRQNPCT